ncbi:flavin monoamine oxidase family protein [Mangrovitalea sediminis]|uniref:flavin monoamine oxidase family protein n=1 Tax=Mangrovitalea sediminis TaxID=1982043 RepID=UPI000BE4EFC2|nr:FAD-dependent oxidoreductase [Mangrovitalea sediminis]
MTTPCVAIVGGGLSGLYAALRLTQAGIDFRLLEARERLGGRIHSGYSSAGATDTASAFDLGPSWFWPDFQPLMTRLTADLNLATFPQYTDGDMVVERAQSLPPQRMAGFDQGNLSLRIAGGTSALIQALVARIHPERLLLNHPVTAARLVGDSIHLDVDNRPEAGAPLAFSHLLLAAPPRLLAGSLDIQPPLRPQERNHWVDMPTWMAPHAKYVAIYDAPFWRQQGLSGMARSMVGPLAEIHDATSAKGQAALFGFVGVPADVRQRLGPEALKHHCRTQLERLFGPQAGAPLDEHLKDWASDPFTATAADREPGDHPVATVDLSQVTGPWAGRMMLISSEAALEQPGYMEGALQATARILPLLERLNAGSSRF